VKRLAKISFRGILLAQSRYSQCRGLRAILTSVGSAAFTADLRTALRCVGVNFSQSQGTFAPSSMERRVPFRAKAQNPVASKRISAERAASANRRSEMSSFNGRTPSAVRVSVGLATSILYLKTFISCRDSSLGKPSNVLGIFCHTNAVHQIDFSANLLWCPPWAARPPAGLCLTLLGVVRIR